MSEREGRGRGGRGEDRNEGTWRGEGQKEGGGERRGREKGKGRMSSGEHLVF